MTWRRKDTGINVEFSFYHYKIVKISGIDLKAGALSKTYGDLRKCPRENTG